jgi:hypothetical protein
MRQLSISLLMTAGRSKGGVENGVIQFIIQSTTNSFTPDARLLDSSLSRCPDHIGNAGSEGRTAIADTLVLTRRKAVC